MSFRNWLQNLRPGVAPSRDQSPRRRRGSSRVASARLLVVERLEDFAPGETSKTITVPVYGNRAGEPNETFVVSLSSPTNAYIATGQGLGTIVDDGPRFSITDVTRREGNGKTTTFTFTVTLSAPHDQPVTVRYATADGTATTAGTDYAATSGTLTFAPGETSKTITVVVKGDRKKETNETFYLDLFDDSGTSFFTRSRGTGTILNDD